MTLKLRTRRRGLRVLLDHFIAHDDHCVNMTSSMVCLCVLQAVDWSGANRAPGDLEFVDASMLTSRLSIVHYIALALGDLLPH